MRPADIPVKRDIIIIAAVNGDDTMVNDQPVNMAAANSAKEIPGNVTCDTILVRNVTLIMGLTPT